MLHVVAGIIELDGRFLLCRRHRNERRFPLKWEFPGGKVEPGESPEQAIIRELREELGIEVRELRPIMDYDFRYPCEPTFHLHFFHIPDFGNTIQNIQFETTAWITKENMMNYDLLDGDKPFVRDWIG